MAPVLSNVLLRTQSDARLVALAAAGHERAFEAICDRHRPVLARSLRRIMPPSRVDDALQQAFLNAWTALANGAEVRDLVPWLHRIARNAAAAALARPGYDHAELADSLQLTPGPEEDLERRDVMRRTLRGLAALPERQRSALLAVAVEGRPHAEVALDLGISETAVRQLVHRARTSLRTAVGAVVPAPLLSWALTAGHTVAAGEGAAGAAIGLGGASTIASALKVGILVAAVSAPVVHHEATRHTHPRPDAQAAVAHVTRGAVALPAGGSAAAAHASAAAGPRATRAVVLLSSGAVRHTPVTGSRVHGASAQGLGGAPASAGPQRVAPAAAAPAPTPAAASSPPAAASSSAAQAWLVLLQRHQADGRTRRPETTPRPPAAAAPTSSRTGFWNGRDGGGRTPHRPADPPATTAAASPPTTPADTTTSTGPASTPITTAPPATATPAASTPAPAPDPPATPGPQRGVPTP